MTTQAIVSKVWSFCNTLRDDGVGYGDYLEQLTYLLFLKMADEYSRPPYKRPSGIPMAYNWSSLITKRGAELELHYLKVLQELSHEKGILGQIFTKAQNKIQDPAKLFKIIDLIDKESWLRMEADVRGKLFEDLIEKQAEENKDRFGEVFLPAPLIQVMVECLQPEPLKAIGDPFCGTGRFFIAAHKYLAKQCSDKQQLQFLKNKTFHGWEILAELTRIGLMNLLLHNIGDLYSDPCITRADSLLGAPKEKFDYVFLGPPFGKKSSMTFTNDEGEQEEEDLTYNRQDFDATTSNKQLNFVQHIRTMLKTTGKAAVVLPDNVLFEGGAGEKVRKKLLEKTDLHTILRLPTGVFYKQGVKANVLFFDNKPAAKDPWTKEIWYYDFRTNIHFTLKKNPMRKDDLQDFLACYHPQNRFQREETWSDTNPEGRWRKFSYDELIARDKTSLDIFWLKDNSLTDLDNLPDPDVLATEIVENLAAGLENFKAIAATLNQR